MNMDDNTELNKFDNLRNAYFVINVMYTVTMVIGFFGNVLIVSTILKNRYLRTPMNVTLVSLALCDIVVCVFVLPVRLFLYSGTWSAPYTFVLCRVDVFLKSVCDYVQPSMLVATSYERYKSIAKPFQSKAKMKRTVIVITATWGTCIFCGAVSAIQLKDGATIFPCNKDIITTVNLSLSVVNYREAYVTFPLGFSCIIIVCIFYYLMIRTLHEHTNKMKKQFKAKPFKNKVHPDSKIDETDTKVLNLDALTIQPLVIEKTEVDMSNNSRQTSGTSIRTSDSVKNGVDPVNLNIDSEKDNQLLHMKDSILNVSETITEASNSEDQKVEDLSPDATIRRISIKKTRDNILVPANERGDMRRFSTVAKHVVLLKSHKRRSLKSLQTRIIKISRNASRKTSRVSNESKTSELECDNSENENKTYTEKDKNETIKTTEFDSDNAGIEAVRTSNESENDTDTISVTKTDYFVAESGNQSLIGGQTVPTGVIDNYALSGNLNLCKMSNTDEDNNETVLLNDGEIKENENKNELSGNRSGTGSKEKNELNTDPPEEKNKISNIDVVDFDGTVHKDVKVEGAVVGAVCVMNKTNRLEGRRKVEMRAAKRIAVLMGSFVLLWLPLPLIALFVSSRRQISTSDIEALITSASISATTIAFNPILNLLLNKQLRSAALTLLRRMVNTIKSIRLL
ncbi:uncharacterized protein LOC132726913 [Ruditapes philippinarum]|uniref:uncharacterized protein LOC132726913 n=1 Tax=Ruditapes philippinarum TaxID=129788 RepID=UPI00295BC4A7|nr:uncharacterized protein LOC132726913 [Ruditapes philippinarum]